MLTTECAEDQQPIFCVYIAMGIFWVVGVAGGVATSLGLALPKSVAIGIVSLAIVLLCATVLPYGTATVLINLRFRRYETNPNGKLVTPLEVHELQQQHAAVAVATPAATTTLQVQVPEGVGPGMPFQVQVGQQMVTVACPPGVAAGAMIQIEVPAEVAATQVSSAVVESTVGGGGEDMC
jgi:hypothetical protein